MRETLITIAIMAIIITLAFTAYSYRQEVDGMHQAILTLERELRHYQTMLDDAHRYVNNIRREIVCVESDMTAREWLWIMADQFKEAGVKVKFQ